MLMSESSYHRTLYLAVDMYRRDVLCLVLAVRDQKFALRRLRKPDLRGHKCQPLFELSAVEHSFLDLTAAVEGTGNKTDAFKLSGKNARLCADAVLQSFRDAG